MNCLKIITFTLVLFFSINAYALYVDNTPTIEDLINPQIENRLKCKQGKINECLTNFIISSEDLKENLDTVHAEFKKNAHLIQVNKY